jgi:hypothetical protein
MGRHTHLLLSIAAVALLWPVASAASERAASPLVDQHWWIVGLDPQRTIQLHVLVANHTPDPLRYHVRFTAEWAETAALAAAASEAQGDSEAPPVTTVWRPVQIVMVPGGPLAVGASDSVAEELPADILEAPKAYRFRAELLDAESGEVLAETFITKQDDRGAAWLPAAGLAAVLVGNAAGPGSSHDRPEPLTGSGTMVGTHEAQRVGSEWVEHGSGVITITGHNFQMVIDYTYDSHGLNAASLSATGTGAGTITRPGRPPVPVSITSATAAMAAAGDRHQSGSLVTRTHCAATGTFDGMAGDERYRGTVTMSNGTQTLDLVTHKGDHRFDIQFTAVR